VATARDPFTTFLPERSNGALLVLAHGAGAGQRHPFMVSTATALSRRGISVVTFDFPYMQQHRRAPDRTPVLEAAFRSVVDSVRVEPRVAGLRLFIGGKSMGGRMATHIAADGLPALEGVVALGYPLHPPGKPAQLRTEHLPRITVPVLIVQGERDTFGTAAEFDAVLPTMRAPVTLHVVKGGDHSLSVRGTGRDERRDEWLNVIEAWTRSLYTER
jgi:predicted alpha/beta-hydrolase family hydrolase